MPANITNSQTTAAGSQARPRPGGPPRRPRPLRRLWWVFTDTVVITQRNLLRYVRLPQLLVFSTIQPVMFVLLFTFVFGGAIQTQGDYINFLIPGILVQTVLFGSSQTTVGLAEDLTYGMIDRFRSLPMARAAVMAGRTLADSVRNLFVVTLVITVGAIIGFRFQGSVLDALAAVAVVIVFGHAFSWVSAVIGLRIRNPEAAQVAGFIWIFPLVFASSAFVPVGTMPEWLQIFARHQPISITVDAVRSLTMGAPTDAVGRSLAWSAGILAVAVPLAVRQYRRSL